MKSFLEKSIWSLFKQHHICVGVPKVEAAELGKGAEGAREPPSSPFLQHGVADYILDWTSLSYNILQSYLGLHYNYLQ